MADRIEGVGARLLCAIAVVMLGGCSDPTDPVSCAGASAVFSQDVCLVLGAGEPFARHSSVIASEVEIALDAIRARLGASRLRIVFLADSSGVIPEVRIGGYNPSPTEVRIFLYPGDPDIPGVVREHLLGILAHEIHHALRRRTVGYGSSLFEAAITEGLGDHFALEVGGGDPPPWSVALTGMELETWRPRVVQGTEAGYDHGAWFLGTSPDVPRWTGYAVGFDLVADHLAAHPGSTASGLVDTPASAFR